MGKHQHATVCKTTRNTKIQAFVFSILRLAMGMIFYLL